MDDVAAQSRYARGWNTAMATFWDEVFKELSTNRKGEIFFLFVLTGSDL